MVKKFTAIMIMLCMLCLVGCNNTATVLENETTTDVSNPTTESNTENQEGNQEDDSISVIKVEGLSEDFMMGADVSSLLSQLRQLVFRYPLLGNRYVQQDFLAKRHLTTSPLSSSLFP